MARVRPPEGPRLAVPGVVARHFDKVSVHWSILLEVRGDRVLALMFTTTADWNRAARLAHPEEISMAGFRGRRQSYLAPVIRPLKDFTVLDIRLPAHRVTSLKQEFPWSRAEVSPLDLSEEHDVPASRC